MKQKAEKGLAPVRGLDPRVIRLLQDVQMAGGQRVRGKVFQLGYLSC